MSMTEISYNVMDYSDYIYKFIKSKKISKSDIEDLYQELLIITLDCLDKFDKSIDTSFKQYLWSAYRNHLDKFDKKNHLIQLPYNSNIEPIECCDYSLEEFESKSRELNVIINLDYAKKILKPKEYSYLKLYLDGFTYNEIGERYNLSRQRIHQKIEVIKNKLKNKWVDIIDN